MSIERTNGRVNRGQAGESAWDGELLSLFGEAYLCLV